MTITAEQLHQIFPTTSLASLQQYVDPLVQTFARFDISNKARQAMFLAQAGHESAGLSVFKENLNYSASGLRATFPRYFPTDALAQQYARQPEKIANHVYANRMGNGPESSGDGWKHRGRGAIQVTGKSNYTLMTNEMHLGTIDQAIAWLESPLGAIMSAGWYWGRNNLNRFADVADVTGCTRAVNGGLNGLADRQAIYDRCGRFL